MNKIVSNNYFNNLSDVHKFYYLNIKYLNFIVNIFPIKFENIIKLIKYY
ncbi:hypothetical protein PRO82_001321 [Candidatus Protochlamydia amoebophila]|nr:hypothetical protein [Candidatus Protochlamydia amoebophila]